MWISLLSGFVTALNRDEKRDFLRQMSDSMQNAQDHPMSSGILLSGGLIIGLGIGAAVLFLNRRHVRNRLISLRHRLSGKNKGKERFRSTATLILNVPSHQQGVTRTSTVNLSTNGMFVRMNPPLDKGEVFKFRLVFDDGTHTDGAAEVCWVQNNWSPHHPTGMGCRFRALRNFKEDTQKIRSLVERQKAPRVQ